MLVFTVFRLCVLYGEEEVHESFQVLYDLVAAQLTLTIHSVDERDGHLADGESHLGRTYDDLHLEHVACTLNRSHNAIDHL